LKVELGKVRRVPVDTRNTHTKAVRVSSSKSARTVSQPMNELKVVQLALTDPYEGSVTFKSQTGKQFLAFFWGQNLTINQTYKVTFCSLDYPLEWKMIFSENRGRKKTLEATNVSGSYLAYGQISSINPVTVDFGDIILEVGNWTNDERVIGEFIYWKIERLDVLEMKT
jgi:hypothetical protein